MLFFILQFYPFRTVSPPFFTSLVGSSGSDSTWAVLPPVGSQEIFVEINCVNKAFMKNLIFSLLCANQISFPLEISLRLLLFQSSVTQILLFRSMSKSFKIKIQTETQFFPLLCHVHIGI